MGGSGGGGTLGSRGVLGNDDDCTEIQPACEGSWFPNCGHFVWLNTKNRECITLLINLNSGAAPLNTENVDVSVASGGKHLLVKTVWPKAMVDWETAKLMYKDNHKAQPDFARQSIAHEDYTKKLSGKEGNKKYSTAQIELPFRVIENTNPKKELMGDRATGVRILHVHLELFAEPTFEKAKVEPVSLID